MGEAQLVPSQSFKSLGGKVQGLIQYVYSLYSKRALSEARAVSVNQVKWVSCMVDVLLEEKNPFSSTAAGKHSLEKF